ncbi:hypothetical protein CDD83_9838 [Cordyceps sp. RAO-2017]|nr:hypothetical protein CDD83_9838 [Cordyceps sp. RAO-2017]
MPVVSPFGPWAGDGGIAARGSRHFQLGIAGDSYEFNDPRYALQHDPCLRCACRPSIHAAAPDRVFAQSRYTATLTLTPSCDVIQVKFWSENRGTCSLCGTTRPRKLGQVYHQLRASAMAFITSDGYRGAAGRIRRRLQQGEEGRAKPNDPPNLRSTLADFCASFVYRPLSSRLIGLSRTTWPQAADACKLLTGGALSQSAYSVLGLGSQRRRRRPRRRSAFWARTGPSPAARRRIAWVERNP